MYVSITERFVRYACAKLLTSGLIKDGGFAHEFHYLSLPQDLGLKVNTVFSLDKLQLISKDKPIVFCFKLIQLSVKSKMADYHFFIFLPFLKISL